MDTNLGVIALTAKQLSRINELTTANIKGFAYWQDDSKVIATHLTALTPQEITDLKIAIAALPDTYTKTYYQEHFDTDTFIGRLWDIIGNLSNFDLRLEIGGISKFCEDKNFTGLKAYLDLLVSNAIATQGDWDAVNVLCKEQNVDLTDL